MALKGPSLAGPTRATGWTAASLAPAATTVAAAPTAQQAPPAWAAQALGRPTQAAPPSDISKYNLTPSELGTQQPNLRRSEIQTTPLEQLLAQMFPDAAADFNSRPEADPYGDPRNPAAAPSLLGTILGNLSAQPSGSTGSFYAPQVPIQAQPQVPQIPGAPPFLSGAVANLQGGGYYGAPVAPPPQQANPLANLSAIAALAAEQRAQQAEQEKAKQAAEAAWFQQQEKQKKQQSLAAERQRQRSGTLSGWATNPSLF